MISVADNTNEGGAREFLTSQKWPEGLQDLFVKSIGKFPMRYMICDDSGSMATSDGNKIVGEGASQKVIPCTRWNELTCALDFHMKLARTANAPTEFRLLNGAQPLLLGNAASAGDESAAYTTLQSVLNDSPGGGTPLCFHIRQIIESIRGMEQQLRENRQRACVIIATDGESSDGDIAVAMSPLKALPVWVVVRLCTNDDKVVRYWNDIDSQLELDMDVLDDYGSEAVEMKKNNSWMTYGLPIHRLREFGLHVKEFDLLDEAKLTVEGMGKVSKLVYGSKADNFPIAAVDLDGFVAALQKMDAPKTFSPIYKREVDWILPAKVKKAYGGKKCTVS